MKRLFEKRILIFILMATAFVSVSGRLSAQVSSTTISKDSILIGDQVVWSTRFQLPVGDSIEILSYKSVLERDTTGAKVEMLSDFKLDTIRIRNGIKELDAKILLTSFDSGSYKLPMPLFIVNPHKEESYAVIFDTPTLAVNTIQVDTAGFEPMDIKGQIVYPIKFSEVLPWVLLALALVAIGYIVWRFVDSRRKNRNLFGRAVANDPPHIVALRELDRIHSQKLWQNGKEKQFYTGVTDALRGYIECRYGVSAMEQTSSEIMEGLEGVSLDKRLYEELDELFKVADLVKFAKYIPSAAENEEIIPKAVRFVNSTFMIDLEGEKEVK